MRPTRPGDIEAIDAREDFLTEQASVGHVLRNLRPNRQTWTLFEGDTPIAAGGFVFDRERGCWGAWAYLARFGRRQWAFALQSARKALAHADRCGMTAWPIEAIVEADNAPARRTLERLGFKRTEDGFDHAGRAYARMKWEGQWTRS